MPVPDYLIKDASAVSPYGDDVGAVVIGVKAGLVIGRPSVTSRKAYHETEFLVFSFQ